MLNYIDRMWERMSADEQDMLKRIYAPTVVAVPLADARRDICVLPDGEIRSYEVTETQPGEEPPRQRYLSSTDGGLSWKVRYARGSMGPCTYIERAGIYLSAVGSPQGKEGLWVCRSEVGPDDPDPEMLHLSDDYYFDLYLPKQSAFGKRVWFTAQRRGTGDAITELYAVYWYSDDFGVTWQKNELQVAEKFETVFPHKGNRWHIKSGVEPYVEELSAEKMVMMLRTPLDCFYTSYSQDGGTTWSQPEPSTFYGTNTTFFLLRLRDGRLLSFWNNAKPLSMPNHRLSRTAVPESVVIGRGESAFTNRDAAHAAISQDGGKTYIGYRELLLNPIRGNADFRYVGDPATSHDKSVHQFQAFELPFGKILVCVGQNIAARRLLIFDVNWLYETDREENFLDGLGGITTHTYVKSVSGCTVRELGNGHCAWNRAQNAYLMPDPDGGRSEALYICKRHDPRLLNDIGGAVWNFPASRQGEITVELKLLEKQARFSLADRWYNTCDPYVTYQVPFWFEVDAEDVGGEYATLTFSYDTEQGVGALAVNGDHFFKVKMRGACPTGLSYLILQCDTDGDSQGFYVRRLSKKAGNV
ncbi:MAG: exo-alpha-sialidase [Clostridia bacterium]|nr:exo-alpha-sialidase [Clostridia bacterium]